jgi:NitT/TauT family transport system permease protein
VTRLFSVIWRVVPLLLLALAWEASVRFGLISALALPPLSDVLGALWDLAKDGEIARHALASFWRAGTGLLLAVATGMTAGVLMATTRPLYLLLNPLLQIFYPLPKAALIPLVIILFGLGDRSKIFLIFLGCLLPITVSTYNGLRGVDRALIWSARGLGASPLQALWEIRLPAALPDILNGIRTALSFAFLLLVTSEFLIARDGLGFLISSLGESGAYAPMFAVIIIVAAAGFTADRLFKLGMDRMLAWRSLA